MKRPHFCLLLLGGVIVGFATWPSNRRTPIGHLFRFLSGQPGGQQVADDLADHLEKQVGRSRFREHADNILDTHGSAGPLEINKIPTVIRNLAAENFTAEVCMEDQQTTYLHLSWGLQGIYAGRTDFRNPPREWYRRSVQPGIYVYFQEH